ncbi:MAG: transposase [Thermomicrobia bacterium]|nr:transposase [Thermomicrobia bacterium]
MLLTAKQRGFAQECLHFDGWYASIDNLRMIRDRGGHWLTRLKGNRLVNPDRTGNRAVVWLRDYGLIRVF